VGAEEHTRINRCFTQLNGWGRGGSESSPHRAGSIVDGFSLLKCWGAVYTSEAGPSLQLMADGTRKKKKNEGQDYNTSFQASSSLVMKWKLSPAPLPCHSSCSEGGGRRLLSTVRGQTEPHREIGRPCLGAGGGGEGKRKR
jgi:hypothetical protein